MKKILSILTNIFPPTRGKVTLKSALPLILYLILFISFIIYCEVSNFMMFTSPLAFCFSLVFPWVWWLNLAGYSGLRGARSTLALCLRFILISVVIILLAEPRAVRKSDELSVIFSVDISDSMSEEAIDMGINFAIDKSSSIEKPSKDEVGLVVFGKNAAVELPPRINLPFEAINSRIQKYGTNLSKSLSLSAALLPEDKNGRIILVTDGSETEGSILPILNQLKARKIQVDVLPITYQIPNEVWLEKLGVPKNIKIGETYDANLILSSLQAGKGELILEENGVKIYSKNISYNQGKNRLKLPLYLRKAGYYEYTARIIPEKGKDVWKKNNVAVNSVFLQGKGKVLLVYDSAGDEKDRQYLIKALKLSKRDVEVIPDYEFPREALSLMPYDCVIFVNVAADRFDRVQMTSLRDSIYNQGTGFLMVGGKNSFGPGGYHNTPIEEALPLDMDIKSKKIMPKGALAIILHTCEFPQGNFWAKRISKSAINVLGGQDDVGLLSWEGTEKWIFPLTPAKNRAQLFKLINSCAPSDMPSFVGTMEMALSALKLNNASVKHVIIISDGDPALPSPQLLNEYREAKVTVTTVLVDGYHGASFAKPMRMIANATGGKFYHAKNPNQLPSIFIKEAKTLKKSMIQNRKFLPLLGLDATGIMKGINNLPVLYGYTVTTPKENSLRCSVVLQVPEKPSQKVKEDEKDPLLAIGRFGVGKSAAFTSDLSSNWAKMWVSWGHYQQFINQLIIDISRVSKQGYLRMNSYVSGNNGVVVIEDFNPEESFLEIGVNINGPEGKNKKIKLKQIGSGRYQGEFELWGKGRYQLLAFGMGTNRKEKVLGGLVVPYASEYLRFRSNPILLKKIADSTNGKIINNKTEAKDIFRRLNEPKISSRPIFDLFLLMLVLLIPLDVAMRRIQLDFYVIKKWFGIGGRSETTKTVGALLKRKKSVSFTSADSANFEPQTPLIKEDLSKVTKQPKIKTPQKTADSAKPLPKEGSTTGKLLAKKRQKKD